MMDERIRVARARKQLTLRDVADACGCSYMLVHKWENGKTMPNSGHLLSLCELLDVSAEWLISAEPLDFHSTETAPQGKHAKYWVRQAIAELREEEATP